MKQIQEKKTNTTAKTIPPNSKFQRSSIHPLMSYNYGMIFLY